MPSSGPAPASRGAETPTPPDWHSHGLNRLGHYRLATAAGALPRPARLLLARGFGRLFAHAVRSNLSSVLAGARPAVIEARVSETFANFGAFFADLLTLLEIEPAIWVKPGEEQTALATMVGALERVIRAYPTQWFNFFDAWSPSHGRA